MGLFDFPNFNLTNLECIYLELIFACATSLLLKDAIQWFCIVQCFLCLFVCYESVNWHSLSYYFIYEYIHMVMLKMLNTKNRTMWLFILKARGDVCGCLPTVLFLAV